MIRLIFITYCCLLLICCKSSKKENGSNCFFYAVKDSLEIMDFEIKHIKLKRKYFNNGMELSSEGRNILLSVIRDATYHNMQLDIASCNIDGAFELRDEGIIIYSTCNYIRFVIYNSHKNNYIISLNNKGMKLIDELIYSLVGKYLIN